MNNAITVFKSGLFQEQVNSLTFKENNFAFKKCRALVEMIKADLYISHLEKIEKQGFELPLYLMKTQKNWRVILTLDQNNILTYLRLIELKDVETALETLHLDDVFPCDFKVFW